MRFWGAGENSRRRRLLLRATTAQGCYYCRSSSGTVDALTLANVLDAGTDDTLLAIAVALSTPADLLRLALTCRAAAQRFYFTATSYSSGGVDAVPSGGGGAAAAATAQQHSELSKHLNSGSGSRRLPPRTPLEMIASDEQVPPTEITDFAVESQNPLLVFS